MTLFRKPKPSETNTSGSTMSEDVKRSNSAPTTYEGTLRFSPRQREYLSYIFEGHSLEEIANLMFVTVKAVKFAITTLNRKLGTRRRAEIMTRFVAGDFPPEVMGQLAEITLLHRKRATLRAELEQMEVDRVKIDQRIAQLKKSVGR
jgi:DNA-binding CsgD family transcriptional regulator